MEELRILQRQFEAGAEEFPRMCHVLIEWTEGGEKAK